MNPVSYTHLSGIAILVKAWTKGLYGNGIPLWITNLILNVPLFLLATKIKGFAFVRKALLGDISLTIWLATVSYTHLDVYKRQS